MQFFTALLSALALAASTTASFIPVAKRSELFAYRPNITAPTAQAVWTVGSQQLVQWDTSILPNDGHFINSSIRLGFYNDTSAYEDYGNPLVSGFDLNAGNQSITVPNVPYPGLATYFVVLYGDSGDLSANFTINGA